MKITLGVFFAVGILGCSGRGELTQADQATPEEREAYRKKIEQIFLMETVTQRSTFGSEPVVWTHEGRKVRETAPSRLVPVTPKLPARKDIVRIEFKNHRDPYWVAEAPAEIDRICEAVLRDSRAAQRPASARYFYPDGSSFEAPLVWEVYSHACGLGLYFYGPEKFIYEISGHPGAFWWELRHTGEADIQNLALNAIVEESCRRSPAYQKAYGEK